MFASKGCAPEPDLGLPFKGNRGTAWGNDNSGKDKIRFTLI